MPGSRALALLCAADLVVALDGMVVMVALPAIERDLGSSQADLQWVVTAYTLTLGAFLLALGLARFEHARADGAAYVATALVLLAAFVAVERRTAAPMVRLAVLRHRPLAGANLAIAANAGGFVGMTFMAPLYMQQVLGLTPLEGSSASCRSRCRRARAGW